jgi:hypothetical protein
MSNGWVKLHRSLLKWEWFSDPSTAHFFTYCLLKASHNNYNWRGKKLNTGQFPFGLRQASTETGLTIKVIRTRLKRLKETHELAIETSAQGSVITIINWDKYQEGAHDGANKGQTKGKQRALTNKVKKVKKVKNKETEFEIDLIYAAYPKKVGKKKGIDHLIKIIDTVELFDTILLGAKNYSMYVTHTETDLKYVKNFTTWVNQECWSDEHDVVDDLQELKEIEQRLTGQMG